MRVVIGSLAVLAASVLAGVAHAQTLTALELKCMRSATIAEAKFVAAKAKCVSKCFYEYWHSGVMATYDDCLPPYGGVTEFCINDALKGAEAKFAYAFYRACENPLRTDCPECYSGGDCGAAADARVAEVEGIVDDFVPGIFCERQDAMPQEQKCEYAVIKAIAKSVAAQYKCYAKCQYNAFKGLFPASQCLPPVQDAATAVCLDTVEAKAAVAIDKKCNDAEVPHSVPECDSPYPAGAAWSNLARVWIDGSVHSRYCGSPSGAFLD